MACRVVVRSGFCCKLMPASAFGYGAAGGSGVARTRWARSAQLTKALMVREIASTAKNGENAYIRPFEAKVGRKVVGRDGAARANTTQELGLKPDARVRRKSFQKTRSSVPVTPRSWLSLKYSPRYWLRDLPVMNTSQALLLRALRAFVRTPPVSSSTPGPARICPRLRTDESTARGLQRRGERG